MPYVTSLWVKDATRGFVNRSVPWPQTRLGLNSSRTAEETIEAAYGCTWVRVLSAKSVSRVRSVNRAGGSGDVPSELENERWRFSNIRCWSLFWKVIW